MCTGYGDTEELEICVRQVLVELEICVSVTVSLSMSEEELEICVHQVLV